MRDLIEKIFNGLAVPFPFGQILVQKREGGAFALSHREDESLDQPETFQNAEDAIEIAKYDDAGNYRPLKTAPNLRHGWLLELASTEQLRCALDYFYPGRLAIFAAWKSGQLKTTPLRETLNRQTGMYRVAAKIFDTQIDDVVAGFCLSNSGCIRTILWKRDQDGVIASTKLPKQKFDPSCDQAVPCNRRPAGDAPPLYSETGTVPLLCQEPCNLLVAECRKVVKADNE